MKRSAIVALGLLFVATAAPAASTPLEIAYGIVIRDSATDRASYRMSFRAFIPTAVPSADFEPKLDEVSFGVGPYACVTLPARARGLHVKVRKKGTHLVYLRPGRTKTWLRLLDVNFASGVVRVVANKIPLGDAGASPDGVALALRLGGLDYAGVLGGTGDGGGPQASSDPYPFTPLDSSLYADVQNASTTVVSDANGWAAVWTSYCHDAAPRPEVDFTTNVVAAVFIGARDAKNYDLVIQDVRRVNDQIVVQYLETRPGGQCSPAFDPIALAAFASISRGSWGTLVFEHLVKTDCIAGR